MKCKQCGANISGDGAFCSECGAPIEIAEEENAVTNEDVSSVEKDIELKNNDNGMKKGFKLGKETIIVAVIALLLGTIVSGILTYNIAARPVLSKMASVEQKEKDAEQLLKDAEQRYQEADEYYAKISNIEVSATEPKKVHLQGKVKVGVDIAPGMYSMKSKTGNYCSAHRYTADEEEEGWGDLIANGYGDKELGQVILKPGETVNIGDGIITFTPIND